MQYIVLDVALLSNSEWATQTAFAGTEHSAALFANKKKNICIHFTMQVICEGNSSGTPGAAVVSMKDNGEAERVGIETKSKAIHTKKKKKNPFTHPQL